MSIAQFINGLTVDRHGQFEPKPNAPVYLPPVPEPPPPKRGPGRPRKHAVPTAPLPPSKAFPGRRVAGSSARIKKRADKLARRTERFTLYMTPVAMQALRCAAHRRGGSISSLVHDCVRVGLMIACPREEWPEAVYW